MFEDTDDVGEDEKFLADEIHTIIEESIEANIGGKEFSSQSLNKWMNSIVGLCLSNLTKLQKSFKYIVSCVIMQKTGAGVVLATSCYWDKSMDGSCTVRWENKTIYCILTVFGIAI